MPSLSAVSQFHVSLVTQDFLLIHVWEVEVKLYPPPCSYHLYLPIPIILLLLPIHLFVHIHFASCLLIVVVPHHLFLLNAYSRSPWANCFHQHLKALAGRPPGCSKKKLSHTQFHLRPVQPDRGFHSADDGAQFLPETT